MTKLATLRSRLESLRRRRKMARLGTALSGLAVAVAWTLAGAFVVDWTLMMSRMQRFIMLLLLVGVIAWAFRRLARPWLYWKESAIDVALLVEHQHKIDSDLVAAMQFESPQAVAWGSRQLREKVIDCAAEFGNGWNILQGFSYEDLTRRARILAVTFLLLLTGLFFSPWHATAFLNRLLLGSAHYPTRTQIDRVLVNGNAVESSRVRAPFGAPARLNIHASGDLPNEGFAVLRSVGGTESRVKLTRNAAEATAFNGQTPDLVDATSFQLYIGDAWTDPATIEVLALPVVEVKLTPTFPDYARATERETEANPGAREMSVLEGSRVDLEVTCRNKSLKDATVTIDGNAYPLKAPDQSVAASRGWTLDTERTPLAQVTKPIRYDIQVTDADDMRLQKPIQGLLHVKSVQRPRIVASVVSNYVLPTTALPIEYRCSDDYGIQKLLVHLDIVGGNGAARSPPPMPARATTSPILHDKLPLKGIYKLELQRLGLVKGDQVKVVLEAVGYRGARNAGQSAMSEPLVLQVTDEAGILAEISEPDERTANIFDEIIDRQLDIGAAPNDNSSRRSSSIPHKESKP